MRISRSIAVSAAALIGGIATASAQDIGAAHETFRKAFNERAWTELRKVLADDIVFHRANSPDVYLGPDAVVGRLETTIAGEWNVKFTKLDTTSQFTGKDGRVIERGDFAITAGAESDSCWRGSYMMTWAPDGDDYKLQTLAWQDAETEMGNC